MRKQGKERVLKYMQDFGSITTLEAIRELGDTRLSDKIYRLKKDGYVIVTEEEHGINRWGEKTTYVRYKLAENPKMFKFSMGVEQSEF